MLVQCHEIGRVHPPSSIILAYSLSSRTGQGSSCTADRYSIEFNNLKCYTLSQLLWTIQVYFVPMKSNSAYLSFLLLVTRRHHAPWTVNQYLVFIINSPPANPSSMFSFTSVHLVLPECSFSWCTVPYWVPNFVTLAP